MRTGRWNIAAARLAEAADLGSEMTQAVFAAYAPECLARLHAATGDEQRRREQAARATVLIDRHDNELGRLYVDSALGLLELGLGRPEAAISHLERARDRALRHGLTEPNVVRRQADLIEAHVRAGAADAAKDALRAFERQAADTGSRWALGAAARCRGLLAEGPGAPLADRRPRRADRPRTARRARRRRRRHGARRARGPQRLVRRLGPV